MWATGQNGGFVVAMFGLAAMEILGSLVAGVYFLATGSVSNGFVSLGTGALLAAAVWSLVSDTKVANRTAVAILVGLLILCQLAE